MTEPPRLVLDTRTVRPEDVGPALRHLTTGWRLHLVGPERHVLLLRAAALAHGAMDAEITTETTGDGTRTVYCAHCHHRFPTERPSTPIGGGSARCPGCGTALAVAEHVSRHHGAHLGVPV